MLKIALAGVVSFLMTSGALAHDGARAYFYLPEGTDILSLDGTFLHTEVGGSSFDVNVVTPSYQRTIDVWGDAGTILIGMPVGNLSASVATPMGPLDQSTALAQGDFFVGGQLGLVGLPSLAPANYVQYKPGVQVSVAAKLFLPTGNYDPNRLLNLGTNRWSLQASLPVTYVLGSSMVDPQVTTFELVPSVHIFGDNNDPFGGVTVTSQAPIWSVEGHITHSFSPSVWAAVDGFYELGGETSTNRVADGNAQQSLSLGATLGLTLSQSFALRLSYNQMVYSNVTASVARGFEITSAYSF